MFGCRKGGGSSALAKSSVSSALRASSFSALSFSLAGGNPCKMASTILSSSRSVRSSSLFHTSRSAPRSMRRRFTSFVNSAQNSLNSSGPIRCFLRPFSMEASSASRRMFTRLSQVPLLRAVEHPMRSFEIIEYPPPQQPHFISPPNRCFGRRRLFIGFELFSDLSKARLACRAFTASHRDRSMTESSGTS